MQITIITPSYNQNQFIETTIESVIKQSYSNIQYIVVDGISTDETIKTLKKYQKNISKLIIEEDTGQSDAINKGIRYANGSIINWLNSDDYYEKDALSTIAREFSDPSVNVVCGKSRLFNSKGTVKISRGTDVYPDNVNKTIGWARIDQPETFFRKVAWDKVGLLNETLHYTMDREWWMRYLYHFGLKGIRFTDNILVNFRLHDNSKTQSSAEKFQIEHDSLFYILADATRNKKVQSVISEVCTINPSIDSEIRNWNDKEIVIRTLNYYLLKRADEFYYNGAAGKSKEFLKLINADLLDSIDQKLLKKLRMRTKLPSRIIQFFRR